MSEALTTTKPEAKPYLQMQGGSFRPTDPESLFRLASIFHKAGMLPKGFETPEKVALAIMLGMEVGLSPGQALQGIMVVNNRPTIWGDAALALVRSSGLLEDFREEYTGEGVRAIATCTAKRKGQATPIVRSFTWADAVRAGLASKDLYKLYPQRMLPSRARGFCLRDGFADVLKGLAIREEVDDYQPTAEAVRLAANDQPESKALTDKIDSLIVDEPPAPVVTPGPIGPEEAARIREQEKAEAGGFTLDGKPL